MCDADQEMRKRALENDGVIESKEDDTLDFRNTERMKKIVADIGWPSASKVGEPISNMAWLLVQHADHDLSFQKQCLDMMKCEPEGEVSIGDIAYLEDRVRVNEGRPQLYGTQFFSDKKEDEMKPRPIEDIENLDKRRKEAGLESFGEYAKRFTKNIKSDLGLRSHL